jgi:hypothetical protein
MEIGTTSLMHLVDAEASVRRAAETVCTRGVPMEKAMFGNA